MDYFLQIGFQLTATSRPAGQLGISLGDAHVIRNAGGSTYVFPSLDLSSLIEDIFDSKDALRSVIISQRLLGTREIAVFHHTGCGMLTFSTDHLRKVVKDAHPGNPAVAEQVDKIDFLEFPHLEDSVKNDVAFLKENPLVLEGTKVTGWVYSVETGKVSSFHILCFIRWLSFSRSPKLFETLCNCTNCKPDCNF